MTQSEPSKAPEGVTPPGLTPADLDRLAVLDHEATRGPWFAYRSERGPTVQVAAGWLFDTVSGRATQEDAELVAEVVNALPSLLALARRGLEAELSRDYAEKLERLISDIVAEARGSLVMPALIEDARDAAYSAIHKIEDARDAALAEVERLRGRLEKATEFAVRRPTARMCGTDQIAVAARPQRDDSILWGVYRGGSNGRVCLNRDGEWEYEPIPSSRDDEFLAQCRFPSLDAAWSAAEAKAAQAQGGEGRA